MATLNEIRAKLQEQEAKKGGQFNQDKVTFPHWNIPEGSSCVLRFLPDGDASNTFFWRTKFMIKLPFTGVAGDPESKPCTVQVPCMETWNQSCPILAEVRPWYKDPNLKEMANKYWKKPSYLMHGFVRQNPITTDEAPENPIRRFNLNNQLYTIIKAILMDADIDDLPIDYTNGFDFRINKTIKGQWPDYGSSAWARKTTPLTEMELEAVAKYGLPNLADALPKKPDDATLKAMLEMFEASVDGKPYDMERWGQIYRPMGYNNQNNQAAPAPIVSAPRVVEAIKEVQDEAPWKEQPVAPVVSQPAAVSNTVAPSKNAADILAQIRNRTKS